MQAINVDSISSKPEPQHPKFILLKSISVASGIILLSGVALHLVNRSINPIAKQQEPQRTETPTRGDTRRTEAPDNIKVIPVPKEKIVVITPNPEQLECYTKFKGGNACFKNEYTPNNLIVGDGTYSEAYYPNKQQNPCLRVVNGFLINSCW